MRAWPGATIHKRSPREAHPHPGAIRRLPLPQAGEGLANLHSIKHPTTCATLLPRAGEGGLRSKPDEGGRGRAPLMRAVRVGATPSSRRRPGSTTGRRVAAFACRGCKDVLAFVGMTLWDDRRPLGRHDRPHPGAIRRRPSPTHGRGISQPPLNQAHTNVRALLPQAGEGLSHPLRKTPPENASNKAR